MVKCWQVGMPHVSRFFKTDAGAHSENCHTKYTLLKKKQTRPSRILPYYVEHSARCFETQRPGIMLRVPASRQERFVITKSNTATSASMQNVLPQNGVLTPRLRWSNRARRTVYRQPGHNGSL